MLIALDYDGTYTADPELWDAFIANAVERGHRVIIATMRYPNESAEVISNLANKVDGFVFTSRKAKKQEVRLQLKEDPDIWIDDNPDWLYEDAL